MTQHLLVGIGEVANLTELRVALAGLLADLGEVGVRSQVAVLGDASADDLEDLPDVADVVGLDDLRAPTTTRRLESVARRVDGSLGDAVLTARARTGRRLLRPADGVHLHGITAVALLDHVPDPSLPVTAYVHPWETAISGLPRRDRELLAGRVDRFLVADPAAAGPLVDAGVDPSRIEEAPALEGVVPVPPSRDAVRLARRALGVDHDRRIVAVAPVAGWDVLPDLTLGVAWELQRLAGGDPPSLLWWGMPERGPHSWGVGDDVRRARLHHVQLLDRALDWSLVVDVADVIALPVGAAEALPPEIPERAACRTTPLLCWEGDPQADAVAGWAGTVVPRGDVEAMARGIWDALRDDDALRRARRPAWELATRGLHRLLPLVVPVP